MPDSDLPTQPHDAFVKEVFSQPVNMAELLHGELPAGLAPHMHWTTLTLEPGSYVSPEFSQTHSDLLFSVLAGLQKIQLYLLTEHQSTVDEKMPLRILEYALRIFNRHVKEHGLPLLPLLPFVLHQGPESWTVSPCFEHLFKLSPDIADALLPYLPKFKHALLDLSSREPADQSGRSDRIGVILRLMKLARENRLREFFSWLEEVLDDVAKDIPMDLMRTMLMYAMVVDRRLDTGVASVIFKKYPQLQESMTLEEILMARCRADGVAEGKVEGMATGAAKGLWAGKLQLLESMMKLPTSPTEELLQLDQEELEQRFNQLQLAYDREFKKPG